MFLPVEFIEKCESYYNWYNFFCYFIIGFYDLLILCLIGIYLLHYFSVLCYRNGVLCYTTCVIMVVISIFRNIHKLIEVFLVFRCNLQTDNSLPDIKGCKPKL